MKKKLSRLLITRKIYTSNDTDYRTYNTVSSSMSLFDPQFLISGCFRFQYEHLSFNLEKVLNFTSRLEKSLNSEST